MATTWPVGSVRDKHGKHTGAYALLGRAEAAAAATAAEEAAAEATAAAVRQVSVAESNSRTASHARFARHEHGTRFSGLGDS